VTKENKEFNLENRLIDFAVRIRNSGFGGDLDCLRKNFWDGAIVLRAWRYALRYAFCPLRLHGANFRRSNIPGMAIRVQAIKKLSQPKFLTRKPVGADAKR